MNDRRHPPYGTSIPLAYVRTWFSRLARHQSPYSAVSALLSGALLLAALVDSSFGHAHLPQLFRAVWFGSYVLLTALPLAFGRTYPAWAGLIAVAYLVIWTMYLLSVTAHDHVLVASLLQLPLLALYLGWFWRPWVARLAMLLSLVALSATVVQLGTMESPQISLGMTMGYAILISWFCLEAGSVVRRRAEWQASHDQLTGVFNRRGLTRYGNRAIVRARRTKSPLALAVIDFDDFKGVNDSQGHGAGDRALKRVARHWVDGLGIDDLVARTGGDEFVVVVAATKDDLSEQLRALHVTSPFAWTFGSCELQVNDNLDTLLARADEALYVAKAAG